ncbi:MAG TPA: GNAT family N-acyltransferase, partial [Magnetovibrio sp.]
AIDLRRHKPSCHALWCRPTLRCGRHHRAIKAARVSHRIWTTQVRLVRAVQSELDFDPYDEFCDHLLVIDRERSTATSPCVVGTYRLLRSEVAEAYAGFYSECEFDLHGLVARSPQVLELGRSCIDADYRSRGTMQLLWRGIAEYVFEHSIKYLFGCASFPGTDPAALRLPLAYLYHHHLAPKAVRTHALPERHVEMNTIPSDQIDVAQALRELPPLIRGYLRVGGVVGDGAVIDYAFNTIDVNIIVETANVTAKYLNHFSRPARSNVLQDVAA